MKRQGLSGHYDLFSLNEVTLRTRIISAFPGTGKTTYYASRKETVADSDSSLFSWAEVQDGKKIRNPDFPANYIAHIRELIGTKEVIMVSSHAEVRDALQEAGLFFFLLYPALDQKDVYLKRYRERGSPEAFIKLVADNWDMWIEDCKNYGFGCLNLEMTKLTLEDEINYRQLLP